MNAETKSKYSVSVVMSKPFSCRETLRGDTLQDVSEAVRRWISGGNPAECYLGFSQLGRDHGVVTDANGKEVARVSYNGRVWEPGAWPTPEIIDLDR